MKGIDISMHNGTIDFTKVKDDNVEVIIIKATEGVDYIDPKFEEYYNQCNNMGFKLGFYHFMSEKTSPAIQAQDFYNAIKNKSFQVIPVLDIETNTYGRSCTEISNRCIEFLDEFKKLSGYDCVIYTGGYFGRDLLDSRVKRYKGWIAHYGVTNPMNNGFTIVGHQYSETGHVNGIYGSVDMNTFYNDILIDPNSRPTINQIKNNCENSSPKDKIKELQRIMGINDDGLWGPQTDAAARNLIAGLNYTTPALTTWIQLRLGLTADGIFWYKTEAAVKSWQSRNGLVVDGIAGYNTIKSLALA